MPATGPVTIYHNPRCSKSRQTLALLREAGIEPRIVEYLAEPPDAERVRELFRLTGLPPGDLVRKKESAYREAGLSKDSTAEEIARAIAEHPILLERPIVVRGDRAVLGRPPEAVRALT